MLLSEAYDRSARGYAGVNPPPLSGSDHDLEDQDDVAQIRQLGDVPHESGPRAGEVGRQVRAPRRDRVAQGDAEAVQEARVAEAEREARAAAAVGSREERREPTTETNFLRYLYLECSGTDFPNFF